MPTRITFAAPGVKGGVLSQIFEEEPEHVFEALIAAESLPFRLTARTRRHEEVFVNPSAITYWTTYSPKQVGLAAPEDGA
jgi:hypothetical protein